MAQITTDSNLTPRETGFQSFAGTDISVFGYIANEYINSSLTRGENRGFVPFSQIQTLSISSTRSVSPVRVLGRSSPLAYTRGARTFAGTMVFASINHDVFKQLYALSATESSMYHSTSITSDQIPPFNIVIVAANEKGAACTQAVYDVTLVNYGTTYSIDDLYTEVTYTYVARDVSPFSNLSISLTSEAYRGQTVSQSLKTISDLAKKNDSFYYSPGTLEDRIKKIKTDTLYKNSLVDPVTYPDDPFFASQILSGNPGVSLDQIKEEIGAAFLKNTQVPVYNFGKRVGVLDKNTLLTLNKII
jgi:hypothetical protein